MLWYARVIEAETVAHSSDCFLVVVLGAPYVINMEKVFMQNRKGANVENQY